MCEVKFFKCEICGNQAGKILDSGVPMFCCGQPMTQMEVQTVEEGAGEKHLPEVKVEGDKIKVKVGSVEHPMIDAHYIQWIYVKTENGGQRKCLKPGDAPEAEFALANDKAVAVYEYCNLHGLWATKL